MDKPKLLKRLIKICLLCLLASWLLSTYDFIPSAYAQTTQIYSPSTTTTIVSGWNYPERAFSSDNSRTYTSADDAKQEYSGYGIDIPSSATIEGVYVGLEGYTTDSSAESLTVGIYDGSTWYAKTATDYTSETLQWINFTASTTWTPEKCNQIKTYIRYDTTAAGGCYPNSTFFVVVNSTQGTFEDTSWDVLPVSQIKAGMQLLAWNKTSWKLQFASVTDVETHEGNWTLYDIWSGELNITIRIKGQKITINWKSHIELTGNHPLLVYRNSTGNWERLNASRVYNLWRQGEHLYLSHLWWNYTLKPFEITNITTRQFTGTVYNLRSTGPEIMFFGKTLTPKEQKILQFLKEMGLPIGKFPPFLIIAVKTTYYVDWLPVKIIYSTPTGTYNLSLRIYDWDLTDTISGAYTYVNGSKAVSDANGWANYTDLSSGTYLINVYWYGFPVNGTFSINLTADTIINIRCKIYDVYVQILPYNQEGVLYQANVTVFNSTNTSANKIRTTLTNQSGYAELPNLPNATLTFTVYAGTLIIANTTRTVTADEQVLAPITCDQNYGEVSVPWEIIIASAAATVIVTQRKKLKEWIKNARNSGVDSANT